MNLIKSPWIWSEGIHPHGPLSVHSLPFAPIFEAPVVIGLLSRDRVSPPKRRRGAGSSDIFSLRFAQQPIWPISPFRNPSHVGPGILPPKIDNRLPPAPPTAV